MRRQFILLCLLLCCASGAAAEIQVFTPPDKLLTFDEIIPLQGKVGQDGDLFVNNVRFTPKADGSFSCGLVLSAGKNLTEVRSRDEVKKLRVLRLLTFPDLEKAYGGKKHAARGQIVYLATAGIIEGSPDGNFYPDNPITRGELATWIVKAKNLPVPALKSDVFFDVPKEHWRAPYIKAATDAGYFSALPGNLFGVDDPVLRREMPETQTEPERELTRAEAAIIISRFAAAQTKVETLSNFETGYSKEKLCALNVNPEIIDFSVIPSEVPVNQPAKVRLRATIASREAFSSISRVTVDLSSLGGVPDAEMFEDNGVYSLNISFEPKKSGEKILRAVAADRLGWEGKAEAVLRVIE